MKIFEVGPWVVGSLVEGYTGAVFAWGVLVNNQLVEAQVPFAFYFLHCAVVHPVMVMGIGQILDHRNGVKACRGLLLTFSLLVLVTAFSLLSSLNFSLQYGVLAFLLGPLNTWALPFYSLLALLAGRTRDKHLELGYRRALYQGEGRINI